MLVVLKYPVLKVRQQAKGNILALPASRLLMHQCVNMQPKNQTINLERFLSRKNSKNLSMCLLLS
jgi:hypothetical protein